METKKDPTHEGLEILLPADIVATIYERIIADTENLGRSMERNIIISNKVINIPREWEYRE